MIVPPPPVVLAYDIGVDSTALLIELHARGQGPDLVLTADTGNEKPATYAYLDVIGPWMRDRGIRHEIVSYVPKRFKHWPPYYGILEMCLTNATLPSKSLGGSSCSLKYKKAPQDAFLKTWQPAIDAWGRGQRVVRLILERLGYAPDIVGHGGEAVYSVQRVRYDLVLMDLLMPEVDGVEATRLIRALSEVQQPRPQRKQVRMKNRPNSPLSLHRLVTVRLTLSRQFVKLPDLASKMPKNW